MKYSTSEELAKFLRLDILKMINQGRSSHIGAAFSAADILAVLYHDILRYRPEESDWAERDRVILSKGHAGAVVYAVLAECGFFPVEQLMTHCADGGKLSGHVSHKGVPGVEFSTGSLGHGLPVGAGMAFALKKQNNPARVYCICGDGECQEGTTWETALFAAQHNLDNLTVIIDRNRMQGLGDTEEISGLEPLADKWIAMNWHTIRIDGHAHQTLREAFSQKSSKPCCIIADTIKGKGVSFMENQLEWHYKPPVDALFDRALRELSGESK